MQFVFQVDGLNEVIRELRAIGRADDLATANELAAELVVDEALPTIPRRSGRLRSSTRARATARSGQAISGDGGVPYAAAIHWGRKRGNVGSPPGNHPGRNPIRGRPYLWDAAQRVVPEMEKTYRDAALKQVSGAIVLKT